MIKPVGKNILGIEIEDFKINEEEKKSSIILPEKNEEGWKNYRIIEVQSVGDGKNLSGTEEKDIDMPYVVGQRLIIRTDGNVEIEEDDKKYIVFHVRNIVAEIN